MGWSLDPMAPVVTLSGPRAVSGPRVWHAFSGAHVKPAETKRPGTPVGPTVPELAPEGRAP